MRRLLAVWTLLAFLAVGQAAKAADAESADSPLISANAAAAAHPIVESPRLFTADDLLLFEVDVDGVQLSDGFTAYSSRAGVFLPLGELARLLDLAITVDPATSRADGWVLTEKRQLVVDLRAGAATVDGKAIKLSEANATLYQEDIYLRQDVIEQLLPLKLKVDTSGLTLTITPTAPLPFQEKLERERRRLGLGAPTAGGETPLTVNTPYRFFTPPSVDLDLNVGAGNHAPRATAQYDVRAAGDLFFAGAQAYLASDLNGRPAEARFLLERKDPDGKIAGPFGATQSDLGDTYSPSLPLGARSATGRGFAITSVPLDKAATFNKVDLRGELEIGWEVELYVNEVLRGSQSTPTDGRYQFLQVPLAFGLNTIRLVFYGPRGERREEVSRVNVGGAQLAKGQTTYSFGVVQDDRSLIPIGQSDPAPGIANPDAGQLRVSALVSHGLTDNLTLSAGFARYTPVLNDTRELGLVAADASVLGMAVQADFARDSQGGSAEAIGLAGRIRGASIVFRQSEYQGGFIDEMQPLENNTTPLVRDTSLDIDATPKLFGSLFPLSLRLDRGQQANGEVQLQVTGQTSHPIGKYLLSSTLSYSETSGPVAGSRQLLGETDASGLVDGGWQLRGALNYQLVPKPQLNTVTITADHNIGERMALHLGLTQSFTSPAETTVTLGDTLRLDKADVSLVGSYTSHINDFRVGLQVSLGWLFDPLRNRYRMAGANVADGGAVALQAFIDRNGTGEMAANDTPEPDVSIQGGRRPVKTDAEGDALVTGLGNGPVARLVVDTQSIADPYVTPPPTLIQLVPRPGRVAVVRYAMHVTGTVELHVYFVRPGAARRGLSALDLQLVGPDGKVAAEGRSEFDGTLLLETVRPGTYALRIDPDQAARLHMRLFQPVTVKVAPAGGFAGRFEAEVALTGAPSAAEPAAPGPEVAPSMARPSAPPPAAVAPTRTGAKPTGATPTKPAHHHRRPGHRHWRHHHHRHRRRRHAKAAPAPPLRGLAIPHAAPRVGD